MRYPEQPPPPIIGERYIGNYLGNTEYEKEYGDRYSKFMKDQKFFENYAEEFAPYAFLNSPQDNRGNDGSSDRSSNESYDSRQPYRQRNRHSMSSDEDFVVESSPERAGNRRTIRRQPYNYRDAEMQEERKVNQREERAQRRMNRTLRRNDDHSNEPSISVDDSEEYAEDNEEEIDSEYSDDSLMKEAAAKKKPVIRNHNFYSSKVKKDESESDSDDIITSKPSLGLTKKSNTKDLLNTTRVIYEEEKSKLNNIKSANILM